MKYFLNLCTSALLALLVFSGASYADGLSALRIAASDSGSELDGFRTLGEAKVSINDLGVGAVGETFTIVEGLNEISVSSLHGYRVDFEFFLEPGNRLSLIEEPVVRRGDPCLSPTPVDIYELVSWDGFEILGDDPPVMVLGDLNFSLTDNSCYSQPSGLAGLVYKNFTFAITSNVGNADVFLQGQVLRGFDLSEELSASIHQLDDTIEIVLKKEGYANCSFLVNVSEPSTKVGCELAKL